MRPSQRRRPQGAGVPLLLSAVLTCLLTAAPALAKESGAETEDSRWRVEFVPYVWLSTVKGTSAVGGRTVGVAVV